MTTRDVKFEVASGSCNLCGQKTSYLAVLDSQPQYHAGRIRACTSCLEDAREAIRRQAEENWETGGKPIELDETAAAPVAPRGTGDRP
jgi:hypothetical protein